MALGFFRGRLLSISRMFNMSAFIMPSSYFCWDISFSFCGLSLFSSVLQVEKGVQIDKKVFVI
jgi:hypothetical protein